MAVAVAVGGDATLQGSQQGGGTGHVLRLVASHVVVAASAGADVGRVPWCCPSLRGSGRVRWRAVRLRTLQSP